MSKLQQRPYCTFKRQPS